MHKSYYAILPSASGSIESEWKQCLDQIINICRQRLTPLRINIFADFPDFNTWNSVRQNIIKDTINTFGNCCPAISITAHPPGKPWKVTVEAAFINTEAANIQGKSHNSIPYLLVESERGKELWAGGVSSYMYHDDTRRAAEAAFDIAADLLEKENMSLNDIVRQWNFIGNILTTRGNYQNYQIFNEVRSEYYQRYRTIKNYPAATGVGMMHGGVIIDLYAIKPNESVILKPVENPNQLNAYEYGQQVLKGLADKGKKVKHPPQFERALILANCLHSTLFISGTASIIGQETVGVGDIEKQTIVTIDNIRKLYDPERISRLLMCPAFTGEEYDLLRAYIKRQTDFGVVRQICDKYFPGVPVSYIEADICRDDLLIEIEGEIEVEIAH